MRYEVTEADTAARVGSGDVPVLATPRLLAWMEAATLAGAAPFLQPGQTTVGTGIRVEHRLATPIGASIEVLADSPAEAADRRLSLTVRALDGAQVVAAGEIDRMIVDRARFLAAIPRPATRARPAGETT